MVEHLHEALDRGEKMKEELTLARGLAETAKCAIELEVKSKYQSPIGGELIYVLSALVLKTTERMNFSTA
jgi:hypothetical protein